MRSTALLLGAALLAAAANASAQSANLAEAKKRMTEAKALYGHGDFEQSRLKYIEACSIARTDNCVRSLAVAELAAGRPADAYVHFQEVQRGPGAAKLDPKATKELNELVEEAYAKCGHVEVSAPPGTLLAIDDQPAAGVPSAVIAVEPGPHAFEAQRGDRHKRVNEDAPVGQVVRVVFTEEDLAPVPSGVIGVAPVVATQPMVNPEADAKRATWPPVGAWILGGVGLAGIGVGIGFAVDGGSQSSTLSNAGTSCANQASAACAKVEDAKSALNRDRVIEGIGFGAGGAALVGGLLWSMLAHKSESAAALLPDVAPGRAGLVLTSSF